MRHKVFQQILRDAAVAHAIAPVVRKHSLTFEAAVELLSQAQVPRSANVARILFH
jgi:hypothetical protein